MEELFNLVLKFNNKYFKNWKNVEDVYYSNAIAGECGELCNLVKKLNGGGTNNNNKTLSKEELFKECADIFIYLSLFLMKNDISSNEFKEIIISKISQNYKRMNNKNPWRSD